MDEMDKQERVTSSVRRNNKPLMEKRRRQRINDCLGQLKTLVLQALKKDTTQYSKLEKADILEMTVKHLKAVQRQQMAAAMATDPNVISKYRAGFNECAAEVSHYLDTVHGGSPDLKGRVMSYLGNCMSQFPVLPVYQTQPVLPQQYIQLAQGGFLTRLPQAPIHHHQQQQQQPLHHQHTTGYPPQHEPAQSRVDNASPHVRLAPPGVVNQSPSPPSRLAPSPVFSDSGLSDDSTSSLTQDENGNYSPYTVSNLNHPVKSESRGHQLTTSVRDYPRVSPQKVSASQSGMVSHKRSLDNQPDTVAVKRRRLSGHCPHTLVEVKKEKVIPAPEVPADSENMWRPW